jgi:hypothetical protein
MTESFRVVKHDLLDLKDAATIFVAGPSNAEHIVYLQAGKRFCASDNHCHFTQHLKFLPLSIVGFPCDHTSLKPLATRLATDCGFLVGVGCMPDYDRDVPLRLEGYDIDQVSRCFSQAVDALKAQSTRREGDSPAKLTVVVHDWACVFGLIYSNTVGCDKLVTFDVLVSDKPDSIYHALNHFNYQTNLAITFLLSRFSNVLAHIYLLTFSIVSFGVLRLSPVGPKDKYNSSVSNPFEKIGPFPWQTPEEGQKATAGSVAATPYRCYPYYAMLKEIILGQRVSMLNKCSFDTSIARQPICFIYGEEKNTNFHTQSQLEKLRVTKGCIAHGVKDAGHWCYKHAPDECFEVVRTFILAR